MSDYHISVLLEQTLAALQVEPGKKYIDATLGGGGHTSEIIQRGGIVLGLDVDSEALGFVKNKLNGNKELFLAKGNFRDIDRLAQENGFEKVAGILFDLGVSSHQFDAGERGFSFRYDAPLDMRMDRSLGVTAADLVNGLNKGELIELFEKFGEEYFGKKISQRILEARAMKLITTTGELAEIIVRAYPRGYKKIHPATKVFQALRIAVNDELNSLKDALPKAVNLLESGGRLVIISFHSLEDRIVKEYFKSVEQEKMGKILTGKPIEASEEETESNKRARSAKLRVLEKI